MKTLVYQSHRAHGLPHYIERCLASVRDWAAAKGHDYRYLDDRFFDLLPTWYRKRVGENKLVLTNLARLLVARDALAQGYDRAIWLDADIVVFDAEAFVVDAPEGFAFCRETWIERTDKGIEPHYRVNNSVTVFDRGNMFLPYAIWAHETLVRDRPQNVYRFGTSTALLTMIHYATPLPLLTGVGLLTPAMVCELADPGEGPTLREFARCHDYAIQAVNLTASLVGAEHNGISATEVQYAAAVERLLATRGSAFDLARGHASSADALAQSRGTR